MLGKERLWISPVKHPIKSILRGFKRGKRKKWINYPANKKNAYMTFIFNFYDIFLRGVHDA